MARALTALFAAVGLIAGAGALPASAAPAPPINYVNLGDSYSAGWGAGAPAINLEYGQEAGTCYVSGPDHVTRLSALKSVDLAGDFACAGSTLGPSEHSEPDLTKQIQTAVLAGDLNGSTDLVTLTGGGNDLGFEGMLQACAAQKAQGQSCTPIFEAGITNAALITPLTAAVAGQIRAAAPNARIAWAGYPHLFATPGLPTTVNPGGGFLTPDEVTTLNTAADRLNTAIANGLTGLSNAQFVGVVDKFAGHEIGSADSWMNPLILDPNSPAAAFNLHPNVTGYTEGYFSAVNSQVKTSQLAHTAATS